MKIKVTEKYKTKIALVEGDVDLYSASDFKSKIIDGIGSISKVVICFKKVNYMDSSGVGVLLFIFSYCREHSIEIIYCNFTSSVKQVLKLSQLDMFLPIAPNISTAIDSLKAKEII